jgi:hypothetical protein
VEPVLVIRTSAVVSARNKVIQRYALVLEEKGSIGIRNWAVYRLARPSPRSVRSIVHGRGMWHWFRRYRGEIGEGMGWGQNSGAPTVRRQRTPH